jgi:hypothetical protein
VKRARVAVAVTVTGLAAVLGISLLTPSGGANPALPVLVSDNPADYTPVINGSLCLDDQVASATCRRVRDMTRISDRLYAVGMIDSVTDKTTGVTGTNYGNALLFNARTGHVDTSFHPRFTGQDGALPGGQVHAIERSGGGTAVWIGGEFKKVDGAVNRGLVRWDVPGNKLFTGFNARIGADGRASRVYDVKYFCGRLWAAGDFTSAGGVTRTALVSLDPNTGNATSQVNLGISGTASSSAGPTRVTKIAPSPNCSRVVIIGNFTRVAGHERYQVAVLNVSSSGTASLAPWYSPLHLRASQPGVGSSPCGTAQPAWVRDVDWAPDGTWWALAGTGGHHPYPALCDSVSRFTNNDSTDARPVWINYSGGDTFLSVRVTGQQVYVGGHFRLLDEAVYRNGKKVGFTGHEHFGLGAIAATASSGMSIPGWNDGSSTGRGAGWGGMLVNPGPAGSGSGLWVGGDDGVVQGESGKRIALLPVP